MRNVVLAGATLTSVSLLSAMVVAYAALPRCDVGPGGREMAARVGEVLIDALKSDDTEVIILVKKVSDALTPDNCK
jgi:hypothetical protein